MMAVGDELAELARQSRVMWLAIKALAKDTEFHPNDEDLDALEDGAFKLVRSIERLRDAEVQP